jgi:hypothetical protein
LIHSFLRFDPHPIRHPEKKKKEEEKIHYNERIGFFFDCNVVAGINQGNALCHRQKQDFLYSPTTLRIVPSDNYIPFLATPNGKDGI